MLEQGQYKGDNGSKVWYYLGEQEGEDKQLGGANCPPLGSAGL